jgi:hypothetical protein
VVAHRLVEKRSSFKDNGCLSTTTGKQAPDDSEKDRTSPHS